MIQKNTTMKSSRQHTAKFMIILFVSLLIAAPLADAFRSSATTANHPIYIPFEATKQEKRRLPRRTPTSDENNAPRTTTIVVEKVKTERRNLKYDLGLGKNQPVNNDNGNESSSSKQRSPPTQFLVEHESVRPYPSPLNLGSQSESSNNRNEAKSRRKNLPKVQPRRQSKDVFHIRDPTHMGNTKDNNAFGQHPVIVPINHSSVGRNNNEPAVKFDLNTVWVEMMLHSEHKKLIITN